MKTWTFPSGEDGAVPADWVLVTAAAVALASAGFSLTGSGANTLSADVVSYMDASGADIGKGGGKGGGNGGGKGKS